MRQPGTILTGGGTDGNERLTAMTGAVLIAVLAGIGVTIVWIGQLLWLHLFLGLLVIGPVSLKLLSTGYRFGRYYARSIPYRRIGPPRPLLRGLAPLVVLSTLAVLATGVALLLLGPGSRDPLVMLHKVSFIAWVAFVAVHILGHLPELARLPSGGAAGAGRAGRWISVAGAVVGGSILAIALIGQFSTWTR
jgi:hypothetical protein